MVGGFTVHGRRGDNVVRFSGRLAHHRALAAGVYRVTAAAVDPGSGRAVAQVARLRVVVAHG
jgi:hypothetical protein